MRPLDQRPRDSQLKRAGQLIVRSVYGGKLFRIFAYLSLVSSLLFFSIESIERRSFGHDEDPHQNRPSPGFAWISVRRNIRNTTWNRICSGRRLHVWIAAGKNSEWKASFRDISLSVLTFFSLNPVGMSRSNGMLQRRKHAKRWTMRL